MLAFNIWIGTRSWNIYLEFCFTLVYIIFFLSRQINVFRLVTVNNDETQNGFPSEFFIWTTWKNCSSNFDSFAKM